MGYDSHVMLANQPDRLHKQEYIKVRPNPKSANGPVCSSDPFLQAVQMYPSLPIIHHIPVHAVLELKV